MCLFRVMCTWVGTQCRVHLQDWANRLSHWCLLPGSPASGGGTPIWLVAKSWRTGIDLRLNTFGDSQSLKNYPTPHLTNLPAGTWKKEILAQHSSEGNLAPFKHNFAKKKTKNVKFSDFYDWGWSHGAGHNRGWSWMGLVMNGAGPNAGWSQCRLVTMQAGHNAGWSQCRLVTTQAGAECERKHKC